MLNLVQLKDELLENPYDLSYSIRKFVTIGAVLAMETDVVILDEPTAGQDKIGMDKLDAIIRVLHEEGRTILTITHDMEFVVRNFDRTVVMADSRIIADADKREIFWQHDTLEKAALHQPYISQLAQCPCHPRLATYCGRVYPKRPGCGQMTGNCGLNITVASVLRVPERSFGGFSRSTKP